MEHLQCTTDDSSPASGSRVLRYLLDRREAFVGAYGDTLLRLSVESPLAGPLTLSARIGHGAWNLVVPAGAVGHWPVAVGPICSSVMCLLGAWPDDVGKVAILLTRP